MSKTSEFVVSADWLEKQLHDSNLTILGGSWYLPAQQRDARKEYDKAHIPGAVFFDHDVVVDSQSDQPHAFPSRQEFESYASEMGIANTNTIVIYDGPGMFSAPRVWWMFRTFGAQRVFVLQGGIDGWIADGRPTTDEPTKVTPSNFVAHFDEGKIVKLPAMAGIVKSGIGQIADARAADRFYGKAPEPRAGMRSGHMPGATNLPFGELIENGSLKNLDALKNIFETKGLDLSKPIVTTCGSGVTAAVINMALISLGHHDSRLYDGSWSEWGGRQDTAVVKE